MSEEKKDPGFTKVEAPQVSGNALFSKAVAGSPTFANQAVFVPLPGMIRASFVENVWGTGIVNNSASIIMTADVWEKLAAELPRLVKEAREAAKAAEQVGNG